MTQHNLNCSFKWTEGKEWILNGKLFVVLQMEKITSNSSILDFIIQLQFLFPNLLSNTQANFEHLQTSLYNFHSKPILYSFLHFSTNAWVSALSFQHYVSLQRRHHGHFWTCLKKIPQRFLKCYCQKLLMSSCLDAEPQWFYKLISHSAVNCLSTKKPLCQISNV